MCMDPHVRKKEVYWWLKVRKKYFRGTICLQRGRTILGRIGLRGVLDDLTCSYGAQLDRLSLCKRGITVTRRLRTGCHLLSVRDVAWEAEAAASSMRECPRGRVQESFCQAEWLYPSLAFSVIVFYLRLLSSYFLFPLISISSYLINLAR